MYKKILKNKIIVWLRNYVALNSSKLNYTILNMIETIFKSCNNKEIESFLIKNQNKKILEFSLFTAVQLNNLEITKFLLYSNKIKYNPPISIWNKNNESSLLSNAVLYDANSVLSYLLEEKYDHFLDVKVLKGIMPRIVHKKNMKKFYGNENFKNLQYFESEKDLAYTFTFVENLENLNYLLDNLHNNENHINLDINLVIEKFYNMVSITTKHEIFYDNSFYFQNNSPLILLNSFQIIMGILNHKIHKELTLSRENLILTLEQCSKYYDNKSIDLMNIIEKFLDKIILNKIMEIEEIKNYDICKNMYSYLDRHIILNNNLDIKVINRRKVKI